MGPDFVSIELRHLVRLQGVGGGVFLGNNDKTFAIFIGPKELNALILAAGGVAPPRPLSHNLVSSILNGFDIAVEAAVVDDLIDDTFHAKLVLKQGSRKVEIDCRPSDALVIATLHDAEVWVRQRILDSVDDGDALLEVLRQQGRQATLPKPEPSSSAPPPPNEGPLGDVREVPGIDWSFLDELDA